MVVNTLNRPQTLIGEQEASESMKMKPQTQRSRPIIDMTNFLLFYILEIGFFGIKSHSTLFTANK